MNLGDLERFSRQPAEQIFPPYFRDRAAMERLAGASGPQCGENYLQTVVAARKCDLFLEAMEFGRKS